MNKLRRSFWLFRIEVRKLHGLAHARALSYRRIDAGSDTLHILCVNRKEYLKAAMLCANSAWQFRPDLKVSLHMDLKMYPEYVKRARRFHRPDRISVVPVEEGKTWQYLKINVLSQLSSDDHFCDADVKWNGALPKLLSPTFYLKEERLSKNSQYQDLLGYMQITDSSLFMVNTTFVSLKTTSNSRLLSQRALHFLEEIEKFVSFQESQGIMVAKVKRLSEQLAISIAAQEIFAESEIEYLKIQDKPMDGGLIESYFIGTLRGWD
jgi:hypothetical protein